ncbi:hypothetical protein KCU64_g15286, partial [Aureobasidium melanogenum]
MMYASQHKCMERVNRHDLFTSLSARIQWLHSFLEFRTDDVQALIVGQKYIKAVIPAIVDVVYKKLLSYDITARVFSTRDSREEGPVEKWHTEESEEIQNRKIFLRWYLTKLNSDCTCMEYWEYLDKVGMMHAGKGRLNPLHVDYILMGACLGFIQDSLFTAILSHPHLELDCKTSIVKALGKVIWIQNDLIERWHNSDGAEFSKNDGNTMNNVCCLRGYPNHTETLSDSNGSDSRSKTNSSRTRDSNKTSLGRPIEEALHLADPIYRCPFSGRRHNPA